MWELTTIYEFQIHCFQMIHGYSSSAQDLSSSRTEHRQSHMEDADMAHAVSLSLKVCCCLNKARHNTTICHFIHQKRCRLVDAGYLNVAMIAPVGSSKLGVWGIFYLCYYLIRASWLFPTCHPYRTT